MLPIKRKPILIGWDVTTGNAVYLDRERLQTHLHIIGPPGTGKTRLELQLFKELAGDPNATIVLMNPKGALGRMARDWVIASGLTRRLVLFDPSEKEAVIGYNPLAANGLAIATHAKAVREAIRSAFGQSSFDQTAQLARFLFLALAVARELDLTIVDAVQVLRPRSLLRRRALRALSDSPIRDALAYFDSLGEARQDELAASTLARLEAFVQEETIRQMLVQQNRGLRLDAILAERKILVFNLEQFRPLRTDDVKLLGRLFVNDVLAHVFARPEGERSPVYFIMDEAQVFATQDLCTVLDQGRELGLHCILGHQHTAQLLEEDQSGKLLSSVVNCARTKVVFGGLAVKELEPLTKELFIDEYDPYAIKDEITHLELEPVESRRVVVADTRSSSRSQSQSSGYSIGHSRERGRSRAQGWSESSSTNRTTGWSHSGSSSSGSAVSVSPEGDQTLSSSDSIGSSNTTSESSTESFGVSRSEVESVSESRGRQLSRQRSRSEGHSRGVARSRSVVPFYEYLKRHPVSSRTFLSEEEFLTQRLQQLHTQPRGHFVLKVPGKPAMFLRAARVAEPWLERSARERALKIVFAQACYSSPQQIAEEESARKARLLMPPPEKGDTFEGNLSDDEVRTTQPRRSKKKIPQPPTN